MKKETKQIEKASVGIAKIPGWEHRITQMELGRRLWAMEIYLY